MTIQNNVNKTALQEDFPSDMERLFYQNTDEKTVLNIKLEELLSNQHFNLGLDIGAGPGLLSRPLYERCDHLILLELLPSYEKILIQKYPQAEVVIKSFLEWQSQCKFDVILCSHVLYYTDDDDIEIALAKMRNLLNDKGLLIIIVVDNTELIDAFPQLSQQAKVNLLANEWIIKSLKKTGEVEIINYNSIKWFFNEAEFLDYFQAYFTFKNKNKLLSFANELETAKEKLLKKINNHLVLQNKGKIIVFRR